MIDSCDHRKDRFQIGNRFAVIEAVGDDPQSQRLGAVDGFGSDLSIHHNARKLRHFGQPTAMLLFNFDR